MFVMADYTEFKHIVSLDQFTIFSDVLCTFSVTNIVSKQSSITIRCQVYTKIYFLIQHHDKGGSETHPPALEVFRWQVARSNNTSMPCTWQQNLSTREFLGDNNSY